VQVPSAWFRFRLSAGGTPSAIGELGAPIPDPLPFPRRGPNWLVQAYQPLWNWSAPLACYPSRRLHLPWRASARVSGSHMLTLPRYPSPRPPWCWQSQRPLAIPLPPRWVRDTLVPKASHPTVTGDACLGRIPLAAQWVTSRSFGCNKYLHDFVSHPNGGVHLRPAVTKNVCPPSHPANGKRLKTGRGRVSGATRVRHGICINRTQPSSLRFQRARYTSRRCRI
jgi:hypothetical protein